MQIAAEVKQKKERERKRNWDSGEVLEEGRDEHDGGEMYRFISDTMMCWIATKPGPIKEESSELPVLFSHPPVAISPTLL